MRVMPLPVPSQELPALPPGIPPENGRAVFPPGQKDGNCGCGMGISSGKSGFPSSWMLPVDADVLFRPLRFLLLGSWLEHGITKAEGLVNFQKNQVTPPATAPGEGGELSRGLSIFLLQGAG